MSSLRRLRGKLSTHKSQIDAQLARWYPSLPTPFADLHGKRAIVTGANSGLGFEMAKRLAAMGAEVWLFCRTEEKGRRAAEEIRASTRNEHVFWESADFSCMKDVRDLVARWIQKPSAARRIDILLNNVGMTATTKITTSDGFEITYATTFLSQFLLTMLFLKHGCIAADARIVQLSSVAQYYCRPISPDNLNSTKLLGKLKEGESFGRGYTVPYNQAKAMQTIWTKELQARLLKSDKYKHVVVSSAHPGVVWTPIWTRELIVGGVPAEPLSQFWAGMKKISISVEEGVKTPLYCAVSNDLSRPGMGGKYWDRCRRRWLPAWMEDDDLRRRLWTQWETDANIDANF